MLERAVTELDVEWQRRGRGGRSGKGIAARRTLVHEERIMRLGAVVGKEGDNWKFKQPLAAVEVLREMTIGLGDFEFVRVGVSVRMPCPVDKIESASALLSDFAESVVVAQRIRVKGSLDEQASAVEAGTLRPEDFDDDRRRWVLARIEARKALAGVK